MDAREAKREACWLTSWLIDSYLGVGQPFQDYEDSGKAEADAARVARALADLKEELRRRGWSRSGIPGESLASTTWGAAPAAGEDR